MAAPKPATSGFGKASDLVLPAPTAAQINRRGNQAAGVHRLTAQLLDRGALSCLGRAQQIARFLDPDDVAALAVMPLPNYPNQRLVVANLAIPSGDHQEKPASSGGDRQQNLAILSLAPNQANGCGASYQLMTTEPGSCVDALKSRQAEPQGAVPLGSNNVLIQRLNQDSVFLAWQLKDNCLIVKQQILLNP